MGGGHVVQPFILDRERQTSRLTHTGNSKEHVKHFVTARREESDS